MKITIHLLDGNRLFATPSEALSHAQAAQIERVIDQWNNGEIKSLVLPCESEIIDLRTPQKEQLEALVNEVLQAMGDSIIKDIARAAS